MKDAVTYNLQDPVKYGAKNEKTEHVEIRCPSFSTNGQRKYRRDLKAMLNRIISDEAKGVENKDPKQEVRSELKDGELPFTAGQILLTVSAALGDEFSRTIDHFCTHAHDFVFVGGEEPLKSGTISRMHPDDIDMIFATFIANFLMPSLMKSLSGSE